VFEAGRRRKRTEVEESERKALIFYSPKKYIGVSSKNALTSRGRPSIEGDDAMVDVPIHNENSY